MNQFGERENRKRRDILLGFLLFLLLAVTAWIANDKGFFNEGFPIASMTTTEISITFVCYLAIAGSFLVLAKRRSFFRLSPLFSICCLIFLLLGLLAIFIFPAKVHHSGENGDFSFVWGLREKLHSALVFIPVVATFFIFIGIAPQACNYRAILRAFCYGMLTVMTISVIYSLFKEWNQFLLLHKILFGEEEGLPYFQSFFWNRNTFGLSLMIAIICIGYLNSDRPRFYWPIAGSVFYIFLLLDLSKTSFIACTFYLLVYWIYRFFLTVRSHPVRNGIALGVTILLILGIVLVCFVPLKSDGTYFMKGLLPMIARNFGGGGSAKGRAEMWSFAFSNFDSWWRVLLGFGYRNSDYYIRYLNTLKFGMPLPMDGGYADLVFRYGVMGPFFLVFGFVYFCICTLQLAGKHSRTALNCLLASLVFALHSLSEVTGVFLMDGSSICFLFLTAFPVFGEWRERKAPKISEPIVSPWEHSFSWRRASSILLWLSTPFLTGTLLSAPYFGQYYQISLLQNHAFLFCLLLAWAFLPSSILLFAQSRSASSRVLLGISSFVLLACSFVFPCLFSASPAGFAGPILLVVGGEIILIIGYQKTGGVKEMLQKAYLPCFGALAFTFILVGIASAFLLPSRLTRYGLIAMTFVGTLVPFFFLLVFAGKSNPFESAFDRLEWRVGGWTRQAEEARRARYEWDSSKGGYPPSKRKRFKLK